MRNILKGLGLVALAAIACAIPAQAADVVVGANIVASETWTADNAYILDGVIFVEGGATLTIEPGTVIRGRSDSNTAGVNNPGALVIARGAKIQALGTKDAPVIFTDENDDNFGDSYGTPPYNNARTALAVVENWGGLIMLGRGLVARGTAGGLDAGVENAIEGLEAAGALGDYGNCAQLRLDVGDPDFVCDDDDSGVLNYVSVRYGGFNLSANNEINGITMGAVGRETDVDFVEVFQNKDDGIEFFGGAASVKHMLIANVGDDGVDYDEGWRGQMQFVLQLQGLPGLGTDQSDLGGEHDGGTSGDASLPYAIPTIYNATYVGHGQRGPDSDSVVKFRDNAGGRYYNSAFLDFAGAPALIEGGGTTSTDAGTSGQRAISSYEALVAAETEPGVYLAADADPSNQLEIEDSTYWCIGRQEDADVVALGRTATMPTRGRCSNSNGTVNVAGALCLTDGECGGGSFRCVDSPLRWGGDSGKIQHDTGLFSTAALDNAYLGCASALPIRELVRTDVLADVNRPEQIVRIDPLPAAGSPLLTTNRTAPGDGFFEAAPYRGAFGTENWGRGWSTMSRLGYFPNKTQVVKSGTIASSETWIADNEYILDGVTFLGAGVTLTIEPGTTVRGLSDADTAGVNNPGALVVTRGAKLNAVGTPDQPIVLTDRDDSNVNCPPTAVSGICSETFAICMSDGDCAGGADDVCVKPSCGIPSAPYDNNLFALTQTEKWGGLIMLGRGLVARGTVGGIDATVQNAIEGLEGAGALGDYGDCAQLRLDLADPDFVCDDDDSGSAAYLSVRYGGFNLSANNEINGITMGAVGRGTDLNYVEVFQNKDDGIEFFGGAANVQNIIIANVGDDGIDYDEGWRGQVQFALVQQGLPGLGTDQSDLGGEHDGGTSGDGSLPYAIPTIYNATYIGHGDRGPDGNTVVKFRDNAGGRYYNSAFLDFAGAPALIEGGGVSGTDPGTSGQRATTSYDALVAAETEPGVYLDLDPQDASNQLEIEDSTFWCIGRQEDADVVALGRTATMPTRGRCSNSNGTVNVAGALCLTDGECGGGSFRCVDSPLRWGGDSGKIQHDTGLLSSAALDNGYLSCAGALPIRTLVRTDVLADPGRPEQVTSIDPRPAAGSPLLSTNRAASPFGFFRPAPFRGAFGAEDWTNGWSTFSKLGYTPRCEGGSVVTPDPVASLELDGADATRLSWTKVSAPGNTGAVLYDVLRSDVASTFAAAATIESGGADGNATDSDAPLDGDAFYYLVQATNACGDGSLGLASDGSERVAP